jgi:hypothetical protein
MVNQPGLLSDRNELSRPERSPRGVVPADQCLDTDDAPGIERDLRLIVQYQLIM